MKQIYLSTSKRLIFYGVTILSIMALNQEMTEARLRSRRRTNDAFMEEESSTATSKDAAGGGGGKKKKQSIGLASPGGGFAAGVAVGGIMRGFQRKKILINGEERPAMEGFDYATAISGGNTALVPYAYAPRTTSDKLLDADGIGHPGEITAEELSSIPEESLFSMFTASLNTTLLSSILMTSIFKEPLWENEMHHRFLEPFGISRYQGIGKTRDDVKTVPLVMTSLVGPSELYPTYVESYESGMMNIDFSTQSFLSGDNHFTIVPPEELPVGFPETPYWKFSNANGTHGDDVIWEFAKSSSFQIPYGAYISPDEFAIPMQEHHASFDNVANMTADPFDFIPVSAHPDDLEAKNDEGLFGKAYVKRPFSLAKLLSAGTDMLPMIKMVGGLPELLTPILDIPSSIKIPTADGSIREMAIADGGYNSHAGIASLLHKGVKKIVYHEYTPEINLQRREKPYIHTIQTDILRLFGILPKVFTPPDTFNRRGIHFAEKVFGANQLTNHLFDLNSNGENQLVKLYDMWAALDEAGEPLIATLKDLDVVENKFWGIKGGGKVDLTVIMNVGVPKKFSEQVPLDAMNIPEGMNATDSLGFFTDPELKNVPNIEHRRGSLTFSIPEINLSIPTPITDFATGTKETRMTEILNTWMIEHSWEGLKDKDGNVVFEGFKEIFEDSV